MAVYYRLINLSAIQIDRHSSSNQSLNSDFISEVTSSKAPDRIGNSSLPPVFVEQASVSLPHKSNQEWVKFDSMHPKTSQALADDLPMSDLDQSFSVSDYCDSLSNYSFGNSEGSYSDRTGNYLECSVCDSCDNVPEEDDDFEVTSSPHPYLPSFDQNQPKVNLQTALNPCWNRWLSNQSAFPQAQPALNSDHYGQTALMDFTFGPAPTANDHPSSPSGFQKIGTCRSACDDPLSVLGGGNSLSVADFMSLQLSQNFEHNSHNNSLNFSDGYLVSAFKAWLNQQ